MELFIHILQFSFMCWSWGSPFCFIVCHILVTFMSMAASLGQGELLTRCSNCHRFTESCRHKCCVQMPSLGRPWGMRDSQGCDWLPCSPPPDAQGVASAGEPASVAWILQCLGFIVPISLFGSVFIIDIFIHSWLQNYGLGTSEDSTYRWQFLLLILKSLAFSDSISFAVTDLTKKQLLD